MLLIEVLFINLIYIYLKPDIIRPARGGVADLLPTQLETGTFLGVLVMRIVERRLYLSYKQKTVIKKSL